MNSDINYNEKKTPKELKSEVMSDLRKLNSDIDQLKDHLTPGQIIDDVLFYRDERSPRASFDYLKANPVGTSFLALGTLLLMEDERHRSLESIAREKTAGAMDSARSSVGNLRTRVDDMKSTIKSKMPGKKGEVAEAGTGAPGVEISGRAEELKDKVSGKAEELKGKASEGIDAAKARLGSAVESVKGSVQEGYQSIKTMEPLTYVALGAGLGALTGASLPLLEKEKSIADGRFEEKFTQFNKDLQDALNESANILKNEFLNDFAGFDVRVFGRGSEARPAV